MNKPANTESTAPDSGVDYQVQGPTATITLNNPERRNVLNAESINGVREALDTAVADDSVRVIVLTGAGNTFCAGADLSSASEQSGDSFAASGPSALVKLLETLLDCPKPTIARVQGHVAGGGNGLVAACDLSVAVDNAKFAFSEVRVGVAPAVISVVCLARLHPTDANDLLLTGKRVSAERVQTAGMLTRVVPADELDAAVTELANDLALGGPEAMKATKDLLRKVPALTRDEAFSWTAELSASLFSSAEAQAGMKAFLSRTPPPWAPESGK